MTTSPVDGAANDPGITTFYGEILQALEASNIPFLVGGAYAFHRYTGIGRDTKDLDIFVRRQDYDRICAVLMQAGYGTELAFPHWLAKVRFKDAYVDIIFSSGNGVAKVDDAWFDHAIEEKVLGLPVKICPVEEMIWSKAYVMERERYDGADIAHLIRACGGRLDWQRLRDRFGPHWRLLLSHLTLFGFIYAAQRDLVPAWVMDDLLERLRQEIHTPPPEHDICSGTLLSREQYLVDIQQWSYRDARLIPVGNMSEKDTAIWTEAIRDK